ncbi:MAG: rhodanese-related sulfurtransferase [Burkholderiaceae bacterium]|nr:rhodanese-related sulfurtransferase [Microbacteriaceae bacterium]
MAIPKILLFYVFTQLADPEAIRLWQRELCESAGVRGRIVISKDGMNGTVGGDLPAVKRYLRRTREYAPFANLDAKWSEGTGDDFPRVNVKVREELVSFGAPGELVVGRDGVVGGGTRLSPTELHTLTAEKDVTFFDGRNRIEAAIGHFPNAVIPDVDTTREFVAELDSGRYDHLKDSPVVTYCTGGIRCEVLSALMVGRGFTEVYQLDGGIARYGEEFGDSGLWSGSLYVFDDRLSVDFSPDAVTVGRCERCDAPTNRTANCVDPSCRAQFVVCDRHAAGVTCAEHAATAPA